MQMKRSVKDVVNNHGSSARVYKSGQSSVRMHSQRWKIPGMETIYIVAFLKLKLDDDQRKQVKK